VQALRMTGGAEPVAAAFWLLEAPDSRSVQSRREPDGTGLGIFDATGAPEVNKWPVAAYEDRAFAEEARHVTSTTFIAHIRYPSTGAVETKNTYPRRNERGNVTGVRVETTANFVTLRIMRSQLERALSISLGIASATARFRRRT